MSVRKSNCVMTAIGCGLAALFFAVILACGGCKTIGGVIDAAGGVSNLVDVATGGTHGEEGTNGTQGTEGTQGQGQEQDGVIAAGVFERPVVAVGADGAVYVAAEGGGMGSVWFFRQPAGKSTWTGGLVVKSEKGGAADASRVYVPDIAEKDGTVWVSMRLGVKEWGSMYGPGVWIHKPDGSGAFYFLGEKTAANLTKGAARLAIDPGLGVVLMAKNGVWGAVGADGAVTRTGTFPAGLTGEKFDFDIDGAGTWHTAHNGSAFEPSAYARTGSGRQTWADLVAYPEQADDLRYISICAADGKAYCIANLGGSTRVQVMDAGRPRFPIAALPSLGAGNMEQRCPPRLAAAPGGVVAVWRAGKDIVAVRVEAGLKGAKPVKVAGGEFPDVAAGPDGRLHLVFVAEGALRHRVIAAP